MRVGAGNRLGDIALALAANGRAMPHGTWYVLSLCVWDNTDESAVLSWGSEDMRRLVGLGMLGECGGWPSIRSSLLVSRRPYCSEYQPDDADG